MKAIQPVKSNIDRVLHSNQHLEKVVYSMQSQISGLVEAFNKSQKFSSPLTSPQFSLPPQFYSPQFSPQLNNAIGIPSTSLSTCSLATPSPTRPSQPTRVLIKDVVSIKVIAKGDVIPTLKGEKVHGRNIQDHESKLSVISVETNEVEIRLYLGSQGCATTIGEVVGGYVVWPTCFLEQI